MNPIKTIKFLSKKIYEKVILFFYRKKNRIKIAKGSIISSETKIGRYTRINAPSYVGSCEIGSFCAIGGRLIIRSSDHFTNFLNMQDYFQHSILESNVKVAGKTKGKVKIGHGVWIGDSVIVLSGVSIGNGAVIGAGSVVTKAIPAYAIAVGNPARVIKYRFSAEVCEVIEKIDWWNWDIKKLRKNKFLFEQNLKKITKEDALLLLNDITD
jgi:virginiamycin A acetyltransferase